MTVARILARMALIALAAALFMGLTGIYAHSLRQRSVTQRLEQRRRGPQFRALPAFASQCAVFALITLAGRKVLRLRLTDRSPLSRANQRR